MLKGGDIGAVEAPFLRSLAPRAGFGQPSTNAWRFGLFGSRAIPLWGRNLCKTRAKPAGQK